MPRPGGSYRPSRSLYGDPRDRMSIRAPSRAPSHHSHRSSSRHSSRPPSHHSPLLLRGPSVLGERASSRHSRPPSRAPSHHSSHHSNSRPPSRAPSRHSSLHGDDGVQPLYPPSRAPSRQARAPSSHHSSRRSGSHHSQPRAPSSHHSSRRSGSSHSHHGGSGRPRYGETSFRQPRAYGSSEAGVGGFNRRGGPPPTMDNRGRGRRRI